MKKLFLSVALVLGMSMPSLAQFTQIGHTSAGSGDTSTVTTGTLNVPTADLITVEIVEYQVQGTTVVLSDSQTNTYTQCGSTFEVSGGVKIRLFYTQGAGIASSSFTVTGTGNTVYPGFFVQAWTGSAASPCDTTAISGGTTASATTLQPNSSITPAQANSLIITAVVVGAVRDFTINGGFTEQDELAFSSESYYGGSMAFLIQTTATAAQPTWDNNGAATEMATVIGTFKSAAVATSSSSMSLTGVGR